MNFYIKSLCRPRAGMAKILLVMRLIVILLTTAILQVSASSYGQNVTLKQSNVKLSSVLDQIRKQTGYDFFYSQAMMESAKPVSVNLSKVNIEKALEMCFEGQPLSYKIENKIVTVKEKEPGFIDRVIARFQSIDVRGRVVDSLGNGLAGATVSVKGGKASTSTDAGGNFLLRNVDEGAVLMVSYLGYVTKEMAVNKELMTVILQQSESKLDEVQVIAYGTTTQRLSTGSISTVNAEEIARSPVSNPLLAIVGRVPGVFIQQSSGIPGSGVKIIIQGQNSIQNDNDPFFVIDGIPYVSQLLPGLGDGILGSSGTPVNAGYRQPTSGNPLNFINPQDIESISILKDADATSIYGSRAQNGAVIITTKKGKAGKMSVNFNIQQGWGEVGKKIDMLNTQQYLEIRKEAYANDESTIPTQPTRGAYDLTYWDQSRYTDWQEELLGGTAQYTNIIGGVSGGNEYTQYLFSVGYQREGTVTPGNLRDSKASVHFSLNSQSINRKLKFNFSSNYIADDNKLAQLGGVALDAYTLPPNAPNLYNDDGTLNWDYIPNTTRSTFANPLARLNSAYIYNTNNLLANSLVSYQIIDGLDIKSTFGYNTLESREVTTFPHSSFAPLLREFAVRSANFSDAKILTWVIEPQLTFSKQIGIGKLDALVGATMQQTDKDRQRLNASGFSSDESMLNIKAASTIVVEPNTDGTILSRYKYNALFARITYNIRDKYILNIAGRRDGSSRFGSENRFHDFGSIGGAWIFSDEQIIKDNTNFLSFGKIRVSYGTTGNDQIGDYAYLNLYGNVFNTGNPYQGIIGLEPTARFPNPYLQWEETKKLSSSLDMGFFKDRILLTGTYYKNKCSNQLVDYGLISITGGTSVYQNRPITVQNTGWELGLNTTNVSTNNFNWSSSFNLTIPRNKLLSYGDVDVDIQSDRIGKSLSIQKVYQFAGVDPTTGLYLVKDKDGNLTSAPQEDVDKTVFIDLNPKFFGGFQNSFRYRKFSLDILFQFVNQKGSNNFFGNNAPGAFIGNQLTNVLDRWQKSGDNALIQRLSQRTEITDVKTIAEQSDKAYSGASYARLKNLSFSFQLPDNWTKKWKLKSTKLLIQGQNLYTITDYAGGDPETRTFGEIPPLKILTVGTQIVF